MNSSTRNGSGMMDLPSQEMDGGVCATNHASSGIEGQHISNVTSDNANESTSHIDWSTIQIAPLTDDDIVPMSDDAMCKVLGINPDDDKRRRVPLNHPICSPEVQLIQVLDYKDLPVDELADTYREKIMILMNKRRTIGELLQGKILPAVIQQINNRSRGLGHLKTGKSSDTMAEVRDTSKKNLRHVVKLEENGCTCLEWQHTGQPCEHALVFLMERRNLKLDNYVHEYFSLDRFRAAYKPAIEPITDRSQWPKVDLDFKLFAPTFKRGSGRRRVNRMKSFLEGGTRSKSKKKEKEKKQLGSKNRCKRCNELGHRQAKCPLNGTKKRPRRSRKKVKATLLDVCDDQTNDAPITANPTTPNRMPIIIPPSLENSPRPITRSLLALAMADGDG